MENNELNTAEAAEENLGKEESKEDVAPLTAEEEFLAKVAALEAEIKEKDDKYLRMMAEYDNFRRRSREEKDAIYDVAVADTVSEILPIIDNLERAAAFESGEQVKEGIVMIAKSVDAALSKLKIESIGAVGEKFNPNFHNAVLHGEDENMGENEISEVFQKGYKKGNKIIRFAMVKTVN